MAIETATLDGTVRYYVVCDICRSRLSTHGTEALALHATGRFGGDFCFACQQHMRHVVEVENSRQTQPRPRPRPVPGGIPSLPDGARPIYDRDPEPDTVFHVSSSHPYRDTPASNDSTPVVVHISEAQMAIANGTAATSFDGLNLQNLTGQTLYIGGVMIPPRGSVPLNGLASRPTYQSVNPEPKTAWNRLGKDDFDFD